MNENVLDFLGLSTLLIGNKAEPPGKHLQLTSAFSWGPQFHIGCMGLGRIQHLEPKQSVMIKSLSSYRPYGRWNRNQGALVPCMKPDEHSSQKQNLDNSRFQHNVCFQSKSYQNCFWPWNKKAKNMSVRNNTLQDRLSTIITLRE